MVTKSKTGQVVPEHCVYYFSCLGSGTVPAPDVFLTFHVRQLWPSMVTASGRKSFH